MRLGWADVVRVDPREPQRLSLPPADGSRDDVVQIPLGPGGEEYLLLETRARRGFDAELPSAGLLVWHVGGLPTPGQGPYGGPVNLVEAHGVDTFDASLVRTAEIAFPTERADALTAATVPSVISRRDGAFGLDLTEITRHDDGSVAFTLGVPREIDQAPPLAYSGDLPDEDGFVHRVDPVTGRAVKFVPTRPATAAAEGRRSGRRRVPRPPASSARQRGGIQVCVRVSRTDSATGRPSRRSTRSTRGIGGRPGPP